MPDKFPSVYEIGEKNFFELLKKEFDIIHKEYSSIKTADDDIALFSIDRLKHIFEKKVEENAMLLILNQLYKIHSKFGFLNI